MKRITLLLSLIFSFNLTAQELTENRKIKIFNQKYFEAEYNVNGAIDKETGFLRINNSENFKSEYRDAKDIALDYLKHKLELYGLTDLSEFKIRKSVES